MVVPAKIRIAIVGGGIGGVTAALALLKHPHLEVRLYEASPAFAEIGAGMGLTPNAVRAFQEINHDAHAYWKTICSTNLASDRKDTWITYRSGTESDERSIWAVPSDSGLQTFSRPAFLSGLARFLPENVTCFNKSFESVDEDADGLTVRFSDGTSVEVDCLLGADGIHSMVRRHVIGDGWAAFEPRFRNICVYRRVVPMDEARRVLGDELALNGFVHTSKEHMSVSYPIDEGKHLNLAAFDLNIAEDPGPWRTAADFGYLKDHYASWAPDAQALIGLLNRPETLKWPLRDVPDLPSFVRGRVALLGDSAHAMVPDLGAGAGMAIEDADVLRGVLGLVETRAQIGAALGVYDEMRRPRAQAVAQWSSEAGMLHTGRWPGVGEEDREGLVRELKHRFHLLWDFDVHGAVEAARGRFKEVLKGGGLEASTTTSSS